MKKHWQLLIALFLGASLGVLFHGTDSESLIFLQKNIFYPIGQIFLRLIFMSVVPLLVSALILAVVELASSQGVSKIAGKTIFYTIIASACSVIIGIGLVNTLKPGVGLNLQPELVSQNAEALQKISANASQAKPFSQVIVELIPRNPFESAVKAMEGEIIALMFFALIFGLALSQVKRRENDPLIQFFEQVMNVSMKIVDYAMAFAPLAVFCLVFNSTIKFGPEVFQSLLFYVGVVVLGLLIQQFVVYALLLKTFSAFSPWNFFKSCREVYLYAFSTASSNATLPRTLHTAENVLKIPKEISRFVLTIGASANQNGTALFEGVTVLFLAQVYGVDLSLTQQAVVILFSILAGIGTAGVPGGSLPPMMILLQTVGIPAEGIGLIIGVDRFLDMCRTTLNVSGDLVIAALVNGKNPSLIERDF